MKDKIREIVNLLHITMRWGETEATIYLLNEDVNKATDAILQATKLDEEKVANAIHKSDHPEYKDCVDCKNARYFAETICSKQDKLTKE